jgi:hypothetical protein
MKTLSIAVFLGTALLLLATEQAQSSAAPFSLTITAAETEIKKGSEVSVNLKLTNNSNRGVSLEFASPLCDYAVDVRDATGKPAPDTELRRESDCSEHSTGRDIIAPLGPHESQKDTIPVSAFSDMSQPGKYSIQVTWKAPKQLGGTLVKSNIITVTVTE